MVWHSSATNLAWRDQASSTSKIRTSGGSPMPSKSAAQPVGRKTSCAESAGSIFVKATGSVGGHRTEDAVDPLLPPGDEYSWTARMSKHAKCGQAKQALRIYEEMLECGVKPSSYTFVVALKACASLRDLERARHMHAKVRYHGFDSVIYVANMLVGVYAKCGSLVDARAAFENMPCRTVVSWNAMILGYAQMGEGVEALGLFERMQKEGPLPNERTFVGALKACSCLPELKEGGIAGERLRLQCMEQVKTIHALIVSSRLESAVFVGSMLVDVYAKCGSLEHARHVFERLPYRDVVSWTAMILGYAQMEEGDVALQLYAEMRQEGVVPNHRTFVGALKACSSLSQLEDKCHGRGESVKKRSLEQVRSIHNDIVKTGSELGVYVGTMLVDVYAKCGSLEDAMCIFEKMPHRDVVSWSAMILGCAQMDRGELALELYTQMQQEAVIPNDRTFVGALKACGSLALLEEESGGVKARCLKQARAIHADILKGRCELAVYVGTMLVDVYAKCGSLVDARRVFQKMPYRNVISWNAMILGYAQMEQGEEALQLYAQMQQAGVEPDDRTFVGALNACTSVARLEKGKEIHAQFLDTALEAHSFVASSLIDMYGKCGTMADAQRVFDRLPTRDVVTFSALLSGYAQQGASELVFEIFQSMRQEGIQPDGITFLSLLTVCSHVGLVDKGLMYFEAMTREYGIAPTSDHYNCVVDLFGRSGRLDQAMVMAKTLRSSSVVWTTLLGACQKWKNVELGRQAFECAVGLDKNNPAAYVLMSNIYAAANMSEDAKMIHAMRLKRRAWKQPGQCSWTDSCGVVHMFLVEDRKHAESHYIYATLYSLFVGMQGNGPFSNTLSSKLVVNLVRN